MKKTGQLPGFFLFGENSGVIQGEIQNHFVKIRIVFLSLILNTSY